MIEQSKSVSLADLAARIGVAVDGDAAFEVSRPASLCRATRSDLSFFSDRRRVGELRATSAGAVILSRADRDLFGGPCLIADNPYRAFVDACRFLLSLSPDVPGVHDTAVVSDTASIADTARVGALAVVEAGAVLGAGVRVGAGTFVGAGAYIGDDSRIAAQVVIYAGCRIGRRCNIESGVVIGAPGFGYLESEDGWVQVPQIGSVLIGDDVDIGANTTIDRGALDDTVVEDGVKMDNQIQIAHNVIIGAHTAIAACTGIAGSAHIGRRCRIGGRSNIAGHLEIADDVTIHATSMVMRPITEAGSTYSSNLSAMPVSRWRRIVVRLAGIDELFSRVRSLERRGD